MDKLSQGGRIVGATINQLLDCIEQSWANPAETENALTLPPLQRNGVWRPKAILDLWRSVLAGLPIGLFYVQRGPKGRHVVAGYGARDPGARGTRKATATGFDVVDGQQRIRALALGKELDEDRRLWVRFDDGGYALLLTSRTQPFGYDEQGAKLNTGQRREARQELEPGDEPLTFAERHPGGRRSGRVYDSDLFHHPVKYGATMIHPPPLPFRSGGRPTMPLADLLSVHRSGGREALARHVGAGVTEAAADALARGFENLGRHGAAFMVLDEVVSDKDVLGDFFNRVGAGGTPLTEAEQTYSAFKAHEPGIRDTVERIQQEVSAVFTPAQIMTATLRVANMTGGDGSGWNPGYNKALKALRNEGEWELRGALLPLLLDPVEGQGIRRAFEDARWLLKGGPEPFRLSDIILAQLRPELWQVLVFWCSRHPGKADHSRDEAVRFAMWWHFGVEGKFQESAVRQCFRHLAGSLGEAEAFPGRALYEALVGNGAGVGLIRPDAMDGIVKNGDPSPRWRNHDERFPQNSEGVRTAIQWWYAVHMLTWLQRDYLADAFPDYLPLTEHEDDLPYDRDHICARARWMAIQRPQPGGGIDQYVRAANEARHHLGNSIGNYRLIGSSENRADGDVSIAEKMPFLAGRKDDGKHGKVEDFCLDYDGAPKDWTSADDEGRVWSDARLQGFQTAVVNRTAVLYRRFFDGLEYDGWVPEKAGALAPA